MARAMAEAPPTTRPKVEMLSPAEVAARANAARKAEAEEEVLRGWDDGGGGGVSSNQWTILDGGVTTEKSVTEKKEWDAFDDIDWGDF